MGILLGLKSARLQVLKQDASNVKALYRRAQAYLTLGDYIEAQQDVKALLINDGSNSDAKVLQLRIRKQLAAANKKEASLYSNMFKSKPAPANGHKVCRWMLNGAARLCQICDTSVNMQSCLQVPDGQ